MTVQMLATGSVSDYVQLKSRELVLSLIERLNQIAPFIAKIRIAKGVSPTELPNRLGVSKQVISRYEESDYQTVAVSRLQEILDAVGIRTAGTLSAQVRLSRPDQPAPEWHPVECRFFRASASLRKLVENPRFAI